MEKNRNEKDLVELFRQKMSSKTPQELEYAWNKSAEGCGRLEYYAIEKRPLSHTTIEESKRLIEAGLSVETADNFYPKVDEGLYSSNPFDDETVFKKSVGDLPCWSLGKLIELMPQMFETSNSLITAMHWLHIGKDHVSYGTTDTNSGEWHDTINHYSEHLIESVVWMVCWLIKSGYLKTENNVEKGK